MPLKRSDSSTWNLQAYSLKIHLSTAALVSLIAFCQSRVFMYFVLLATFTQADITKTTAIVKILCGTLPPLQCMGDSTVKWYVHINIIKQFQPYWSKCDPTGKDFIWIFPFKGTVLKFRLNELHWGPGLL